MIAQLAIGIRNSQKTQRNYRLPLIMFWMLRVSWLCLFTFATCGWAASQQISEDYGNSNPFIAAIHKAKENGPEWFPEVSYLDPRGSIIVASGGYYFSDLRIIFRKELIPELLPRVKALARSLKRPDIPVIVREGRAAGSFDLDFKRYMSSSTFQAHARLPIGQVVSIVSSWGLPKPMGVVIVTGQGEAFYHGRSVASILLLDPKRVSPADEVTFIAKRHWYGLALLCTLGALFLLMATALVVSMFKTPRVPQPKPHPASLIESQTRYEKPAGKATWILLLVAVLMVLLIGGLQFAGDDMNLWLGPSGVVALLGALLCFLFLVFASSHVRRRRNLAVEKEVTIARPPRMILWLLASLVPALGVTALVGKYPRLLVGIPISLLRPLLIGALVSPIPILVFGSCLTWRKSMLKLGPGDPDFDAAMEFGKLAGVKVSRVVVRKEAKSANAFAGLFRTVGVTQGLRDKLLESERRCIIAHEIGHVRGNHVPWLVLFGLGFCVIYGVVTFYIFKSPTGEMVMKYLQPVLPLIVILGLQFARAPLQRRNEFAADRFALQAIGDFDAVAFALAKVHLLSASPYRFKKFHERFASHPSLVKRLNALETAARTMGLPVESGAVERIISETRIEPPQALGAPS